MKKLFKKLALFIMIFVMAFVSIAPKQASADLASFQQPIISFTFDDGFESMYQNAVPIMDAAGYQGTLYFITGLPGGAFNGGNTDDGKPGMTWAEVQTLQNTYGWEIGSHTVTHPLLSTLTPTQVDQELEQSRSDLLAHGITPATSFAFPEGDYKTATLVQTAKYYQVSRGFQDVGLDTFPFNKSVIYDESLDANMTLAQAKALVDQAIANKQWLVFTGHGIQATADPNYAYVWTTANFQALVNYIKSKNVTVEKLGDVVAPPGDSLVTNSGFAQPLSTGWTTDNATQVTEDTNNNGDFPNPVDAARMTGSTTASHLFSSLIDVVPGANYLLDAFVNTTGLTAGEFGFYLDEYDANNNWISGQWLGFVANNTVTFFDKVITATSTLVAKFGVQTYLTAGATGTVYTDNINLYNLDATPSATPSVTPTGTPSVTPTVTPSVTPVQGNLVQGGDFDNGLTGKWSTDNATSVKIDTNNHGTTPSAATSAGMTGSTTASHLFYGLLPIDNSLTYALSAFVNANSLTSGELGFYIDEYDATGVWISGQWLGKVTNGVSSTFSKLYKATTTLVSQIRIQTYLTANSTGTGYVDSVNFSAQVTPTVTPSVTPSISPSVTPTGAPSATPTPSTSVTPTPTVSVTPTPTVTGTPNNIVVNGNFDNGLSNGWTSSNASLVKLDTGSHGGSATNSISMTGSAASSYLFYGLVPVDPNTTYNFSALSNATGLTAGELGFYIDEYDINGNWISGQWLGKAVNGVASTFSRVYKATSTLVSHIRIQTYINQGSTGTAYVDDYSLTNTAVPSVTPTSTPTTTPTMTPTDTPSITPTPTVSVTPTPTSTPSVTPTTTPSVTPSVTPTPGENLVQNPSFEQVDGSNWAVNWIRETAAWLLDMTSLGDNGANSVKLTINGALTHLFSDHITINSSLQYVWSMYVKTTDLNGEFGFYIDEYDASGNWISGQWKGMINTSFTGTKQFTYIPTSANVKTVRLQYYTVTGATGTVILDSNSLTSK